MFAKYTMKLACLACGLLVLGAAHAQTRYVENFSGVNTQLNWKALGQACLTAGGNGSNDAGTYTGIRTCTTSPTASIDPPGFGVLRLTPAAQQQTGAILSYFTFPTNEGLQITFTTYTYGGDMGGVAGGNGADGIVFMLTDGSDGSDGSVSIPMPTATGATGGAMGYSCSNTALSFAEGMANAYLGLGIDEFGNFLNSGNTTNTGILNTNNTTPAPGYKGSMDQLGLDPDALGGNTRSASSDSGGNIVSGDPNGTPGDYYGRQFQPYRIGLRGAGNTTWAWLQKQNPAYYTGAANTANALYWIKTACRFGKYVTDSTGATTAPIPYNYKAFPDGYYVLNQGIASSAKRAIPITYNLSLSPSGVLNFAFSYNNGAYQTVLANRQITADNGPVPKRLRFGFSAGTGGNYNVHEVACFRVEPPAAPNTSAGSNTISGEVQIGSQIYLTSYNASDWSGTVRAVPVVTNGADIGLSPTPNWDANCVLTGGACASTGAGAGTTSADGPYEPKPQPGGDTTGNARVLLTSNLSTGAGLPFQLGSLTAGEQTALGATTAAQTNAVAWLRGDRSNEQLWGSTPGNLRARTGVLGDIINSSPTWVGPPRPGAYPDVFKDALNSAAAAPESAYSAYATSAAKRQAVVYAGSNDGFLHGFRTGAIDAVANSPGNDGLEVLGFMPSGQRQKYAAKLRRPTFMHNYLVDATPGAGDLYYGGQWHTWLVGGVGSAGQEIYALDITDPSQFAESNASALVKGDWTASATQLSRLNCTVGTPAIVRLHNGRWGIIFGNGLPDLNTTTTNCRQKNTTTTYTAGIYIGLIDPTTGAVSFSNVGSGTGGFLDTLKGTSATPNGIAEISAVDADGDGIVDYVYGGDLLGNVWRFDLTAATPSGWKVSTYGATSAKPLFTALNSANGAQPITTAPIVAAVPTASGTRMMVYFGAGRLAPMGATYGATYATGQQAFYGIWDWDWPASLWGNSFVRLSSAPATVTTASLQQQTLTQNTATARTLSASTVCWADQSTCASSKKYGWYFNLPDTNEQIIYNPAAVEGGIVVNTAIPPVVNVCKPGQQTGWTMAFDQETGGTHFANGFFKLKRKDPNSNVVQADGVYLGAVGASTVIRYRGRTWVVAQTVTGAPALVEVNKPMPEPSTSTVPGRRVSWRELRL